KSPDTLTTVVDHLYFNAFQPGSEMDVRSTTIADPDKRVADNISKLAPSEIGYIKVNSLKQNGETIKHSTEGTILVVELAKPILPGQTTQYDMDFDGQPPLQTSRARRNPQEGAALPITQWQPQRPEDALAGAQAH